MSTAPHIDPFDDGAPDDRAHDRAGHVAVTGHDGWPQLEVVGLPRVLLDARVVLNQPTGLGRYATGLAAGIVDSRLPLDLTVLVHTSLATNHPIYRLVERAQAPTKVQLLSVPVPGVHPTQHWRMFEHLRRIPHDIYHYPHYDLPLSSCRPAVVTIHDLKFLRFPELLPNRLRSHYVRGAMRIGSRRARHIVAVSSSTRDDLEELLGIPPYRVTVIPEAAAAETIIGTDGSTGLGDASRSLHVDRASLPPGIRPGYLLFVGERRPHKNLVNLIRAYARAREMVPALPDLVIVGHRHADYSEPERTVELLRLKPDIHFFEGVADRTLQALYAHAGAFLLPSLYEGFGLPILEAMIAGIPVLTSNISSMPEVAGDAALLVDPYDIESIARGICRLHEEPRLRHELITKGRLWSRQFTWQRVARATFRVYRKVLAAARP